MAVKKELIIEISPEGELKIKTEGFKGNECETELKPIEKALGKVKNRTKNDEYYQKNENEGKVRNTTK